MGAVLGILNTLISAVYSIPYLSRALDVTSTLCGTVCRAGLGGWTSAGVEKSNRPEKPLKLYEFENCPFCRKVREVISALDLDVEVYPCPRTTLKKYGVKEGSRFRPDVEKHGGKLMFPFLVDENTGKAMNESTDIIEYLWSKYGNGATKPLQLRVFEFLPWINISTLFVSSMMRPLSNMGNMKIPSKKPEQLLILYSYECSPFCRIAREALCSLELPYVLHNVPRGSVRKRKEFVEISNRMMVPYLIDPNTDWRGFESAEIVKYLFDTYATGSEAPSESWSDYSVDGATEDHFTLTRKKQK